MGSEAVNSAQIAMLTESDKELKSILLHNEQKAEAREEKAEVRQAKTDEILNQLLMSQVRSEERRISDKQWQRDVEKHQDLQDAEIIKAKDLATAAQTEAKDATKQALKNAKWINGAVALFTTLVIFAGKAVITAGIKYFGGP